MTFKHCANIRSATGVKRDSRKRFVLRGSTCTSCKGFGSYVLTLLSMRCRIDHAVGNAIRPTGPLCLTMEHAARSCMASNARAMSPSNAEPPARYTMRIATCP